MKRLCLLIAILLALAGGFPTSPAQAAEITVEADGVSDVLANEFRTIAGQVGQFYQEVYNYSPARAVKIVVVADEAAYARKLQSEGYSQADAIRMAKASGGVSINNKRLIIIPADKTPRYLARICTVTHEMFHQLQAELRGDAPAHVWLTEGSAKLSEFVLLEWLNKGSIASHRFNLVNQLVNVKLLAASSDLIDGGLKWTGLVEQKMYPYQVSELMTDYLMRQTGRQSIVSYFRYLGETRNRDTAFQKAFGVSYGQFVGSYRAYFDREAETKGLIIFESEDGVTSGIASVLKSSGAAVEKVLRGQGWPLIAFQRFILAPDKEATLKILRREQSQADDDKLVEVANKGTIIGLGGYSYVVNTAKLTDVDRGFHLLAMTIARGEVMLTARTAQGNSIYWFYEGTVRLLAAQAAEAAGHKSVADARNGDGWTS